MVKVLSSGIIRHFGQRGSGAIFLHGIIFNSARLASLDFMVGSWLIKPGSRPSDLKHRMQPTN